MPERQHVRIDPPWCQCTDCATGYSVPYDMATELEVDLMDSGAIIDATGMTEAELDEWEDARVRLRLV